MYTYEAIILFFDYFMQHLSSIHWNTDPKNQYDCFIRVYIVKMTVLLEYIGIYLNSGIIKHLVLYYLIH